ncbi:DNA polymerase III subunit gamma/tau [Anaerobacillus isosaccharinicus]|uniref:DNA-directed DNA polymerase n=1 Tax=Anaerobacillus isosaccharinicus TaxID=1532552 RepID=A0A1S2MGU7_9BACI|nr:DNA polymerase III subunit gamma/tau [Anaerobacillus isosaccharinicus]MBA5584159.1 DNA polymerase III subunit gamma/tau [Anaerobacillus isosaccharinicus]QOY37433.1 DNA polymerase III subunit gamma/tau [Anaerobacillus isosaccharinicus]
MSYQALYRVWRPKQLNDVVGQVHITKTIKNALIQEKLSHAYLFTGPRGTGKTSAAKIMAKAVNCHRSPVAEPCNECEACLGISDGSIVDVIEIDAASNNGVDEIRDIRDKVKFAPSSGIRYKVYIIDEVHMLSTGAFNALLKTLEEPPKHVIFILATTEPHKIPLTIISRCQRFDFKRITSVAMIGRMEFILSNYDTKVSDEALAMIARVSEGGMRDALSLLDQAISYCDEEVTLDDILTITGAVSQGLLMEVAQALLASDVVRALQAVDKLILAGKDPTRFIEDFIFFYRDMLLYKTAPELNESLERVAVDEEFISISKDTPTKWIYNTIETLNEILQDMKWSSHPKIFIEVAIVKICNTKAEAQYENNEAFASLLKKVQLLEQKLENVGSIPEQGQTTIAEVPKKNQGQFNFKAGKSGISSGQIKEMLKQASKQDLQRITSNWGQVMDAVKKNSVPAHAWLSDSKPVAASKTMILLAFQNEMHRDMVDTKFRSLVEQEIADVFREPYKILTLLTNQWETVKEDFVREQRGETTASYEGDPIVEEALKLVGSDLIEIID